uniref:Uncharacterized protein n=1 Tax=Globodera rostochiensis TaxID=31243 RepID=A0A914GRR0_GLORO
MASQVHNKWLVKQLIPTVNFIVTSHGLTINSDRLETTRIVSFDNNDDICRQCKVEVELDYLVSKDGVYVYSNRIKGGEKFVPFDRVEELPSYCAFRVRSRKVYKFPYYFTERTMIPTSDCAEHHLKKSHAQKTAEASAATTTTPNAENVNRSVSDILTTVATLVPMPESNNNNNIINNNNNNNNMDNDEETAVQPISPNNINDNSVNGLTMTAINTAATTTTTTTTTTSTNATTMKKARPSKNEIDEDDDDDDDDDDAGDGNDNADDDDDDEDVIPPKSKTMKLI